MENQDPLSFMVSEMAADDQVMQGYGYVASGSKP